MTGRKAGPASQVVPLAVIALLYITALAVAVVVLASLNAGFAAAAAILILTGMAVASSTVMRRARAAGRRPEVRVSADPSILGFMGSTVLLLIVAVAGTLNFALGAALGAVVLFGFMGALVLALVFTRVENSTRASG